MLSCSVRVCVCVCVRARARARARACVCVCVCVCVLMSIIWLDSHGIQLRLLVRLLYTTLPKKWF